MDWLQRRQQFWATSLDKLARYAEAKERAAREGPMMAR